MINLCNHLGHAPHVSRLGKSRGPTWLHLVALRHGNPLAAAAALLGVTGQSESNIGRVFRGPGVVLMMFDAFVAAGAVASPSSSLAAGSDHRPLGATSALSSSCADGRSRRRVTVIPESNAPSVPPLAWVLAIKRYPHRAGGCGGAVVLCRPKRSACGCLRGSCPGDFPDNFYLEVLDRQHRRGRSLPASQGAWPPPAAWLELDDPPTAVHPHANPRGPLPSS
jgi:hypothetical protein